MLFNQLNLSVSSKILSFVKMCFNMGTFIYNIGWKYAKVAMNSAKTLESNDSKSGPEKRKATTESLRMMTGLSRKALEERYHISAITIQS